MGHSGMLFRVIAQFLFFAFSQVFLGWSGAASAAPTAAVCPTIGASTATVALAGDSVYTSCSFARPAAVAGTFTVQLPVQLAASATNMTILIEGSQFTNAVVLQDSTEWNVAGSPSFTFRSCTFVGSYIRFLGTLGASAALTILSSSFSGVGPMGADAKTAGFLFLQTAYAPLTLTVEDCTADLVYTTEVKNAGAASMGFVELSSPVLIEASWRFARNAVRMSATSTATAPPSKPAFMFIPDSLDIGDASDPSAFVEVAFDDNTIELLSRLQDFSLLRPRNSGMSGGGSGAALSFKNHVVLGIRRNYFNFNSGTSGVCALINGIVPNINSARGYFVVDRNTIFINTPGTSASAAAVMHIAGWTSVQGAFIISNNIFAGLEPQRVLEASIGDVSRISMCNNTYGGVLYDGSTQLTPMLSGQVANGLKTCTVVVTEPAPTRPTMPPPTTTTTAAPETTTTTTAPETTTATTAPETTTATTAPETTTTTTAATTTTTQDPTTTTLEPTTTSTTIETEMPTTTATADAPSTTATVAEENTTTAGEGEHTPMPPSEEDATTATAPSETTAAARTTPLTTAAVPLLPSSTSTTTALLTSTSATTTSAPTTTDTDTDAPTTIAAATDAAVNDEDTPAPTSAGVYTRAPADAGPTGVVGVGVTTGVIAVGSGPVGGLESLLAIQLLSVFASMACSVPGVGGDSMSFFLTPLDIDLQRYGKLVGQLGLCVIVVAVYGLVVLLVSYLLGSRQRAFDLLRHPRALPMIHQLTASGFAVESCKLLYGNDAPTPTERIVGLIGLLLTLASVAFYPMVTRLGYRKGLPSSYGEVGDGDSSGDADAFDHHHHHNGAGDAAVDCGAQGRAPGTYLAKMSSSGAGSPIHGNNGRSSDANMYGYNRALRLKRSAPLNDKVADTLGMAATPYAESYRCYTEEDLGKVWWAARPLVAPKTYWLRPVLRSSRCVHSGLRPACSRFAVGHHLYRAVLVCIVCTIPPQGENWCTAILSIAAILCFAHACFLLVTRCHRVPLENFAQALQSAAIGAVAVCNAVDPTSSVTSVFSMVLVVGCLVSTVGNVAGFLVEWRILAPSRAQQLALEAAEEDEREMMGGEEGVAGAALGVIVSRTASNLAGARGAKGCGGAATNVVLVPATATATVPSIFVDADALHSISSHHTSGDEFTPRGASSSDGDAVMARRNRNHIYRDVSGPSAATTTSAKAHGSALHLNALRASAALQQEIPTPRSYKRSNSKRMDQVTSHPMVV